MNISNLEEMVKGLSIFDSKVEQSEVDRIVIFLQKTKIIYEKIRDEQECNVGELMTVIDYRKKIEDASENGRNIIVSSVELYKFLKDSKLFSDTLHLVKTVMDYIVFHVKQFINRDAINMFKMYQDLFDCVYVFQTCSLLDNYKLNRIVDGFLRRLLNFLCDYDVNTYSDKICVYNAVRKMITEIGIGGKREKYIMVYITEKMNVVLTGYKENVSFNSMEIDCFMNLLLILKEILSSCKIIEDCSETLIDLKIILENLKDSFSSEKFVIHIIVNILHFFH